MKYFLRKRKWWITGILAVVIIIGIVFAVKNSQEEARGYKYRFDITDEDINEEDGSFWDEKSSSESSKSTESSSEKERSEPKEETQSEQEPLPTTNRVYGKVGKKWKRNKQGFYVRKGYKYVRISASDVKGIEFVVLDFTDTPWLYSDTEGWQSYFPEWMETDTALQTKISNSEFIYYSSKINKKYRITMTVNDTNESPGIMSIKLIKIAQYE